MGFVIPHRVRRVSQSRPQSSPQWKDNRPDLFGSTTLVGPYANFLSCREIYDALRVQAWVLSENLPARRVLGSRMTQVSESRERPPADGSGTGRLTSLPHLCIQHGSAYWLDLNHPFGIHACSRP
ncbi:hypothetical protein V6N13_110834 [Hibiscus sabdariffa]|uniref:Uncharacterized protein n=1 Tax=Hibiscus sabdariffa TaxID=183260 RepID=A0ABR2TJC2_9ROSI